MTPAFHELPLFDVSRTVPQACPVGECQAIRLPEQGRVVTCAHDLELDARKRPRGCLNAIDPANTQIPY